MDLLHIGNESSVKKKLGKEDYYLSRGGDVHGIPCPLFESNSYWAYGGPSGWKRSEISETLLGEEPSWFPRWCRGFELELHLNAKRSSDAISEHKEI